MEAQKERELVKFTNHKGELEVYDWTDNQKVVTNEVGLNNVEDIDEGVLISDWGISLSYNNIDEDFSSFKVAYPHEQLKVNGIIDKVCPIAKGSRCLIKAGVNVGKKTLIKMMAASISASHPEVKQFALLIDERPEEVSDFEDNFKGKTIASTFDADDDDHVLKAELTLSVLKRLVENGEDVVLYIDSISRLARSYNVIAPSNEKILSGGVTGSSLHKVKEVLGAARCFKDHKGSLTIISTVLEGTDSKADDAVRTELIGTGNCIIQLSDKLAAQGYFPAVDVMSSKTRNDELIRPKNQWVEVILKNAYSDSCRKYQEILRIK